MRQNPWWIEDIPDSKMKRHRFICPYCDVYSYESIGYIDNKIKSVTHIHEEHPDEVAAYKSSRVQSQRA